jgi:hypothetical protein
MSGSQSEYTDTDTDRKTTTDEHSEDTNADLPRHVDGSGGDADLASVEQTTIQRDAQGRARPRREYVEELDADVLARPLPSADREKYIGETLGQGEDITDQMLAELFDEYVVYPDLTDHSECPDDQVTEQFVGESLTSTTEDAYFFAILLASDEQDLVERLRANRRGELSDGEAKLMDQLGPERMQELFDEADEDEGN